MNSPKSANHLRILKILHDETLKSSPDMLVFTICLNLLSNYEDEDEGEGEGENEEDK